ncbi:MAG: acyl-CoA dehydrogenase family protein [Planctomycetes bacterium]|nr:acyl-CoA dehydrogenase family protein [Planctomycetota bacterium]
MTAPENALRLLEPPPEVEALRARVRAFVDGRVLPREAEVVAEDRAGRRDALLALQAEARAEGLWTPHLPPALGGLGVGAHAMCLLFREMGRSLVGPRVFNCDAPDQGNMDLLLHAGTEEQRRRWLAPLARGEVTSAFCMTEPAPGAGADPANLRTRARPDGDGWVLDGRKWFATGAGEAAVLLVLARTSDDPARAATLFLVPRDAPGVVHVRDVPTMAEPLLAHREAELRLEGVRVGPEGVLGEVGAGLKLAQRRLVPARLTHCMRWLGLADRALSLCREHVRARVSFGRPLAEHQLVQEMLWRGAAAIHAGNLMTVHAAVLLERGLVREARPYSSLAKVHVARALCQVLDDAIQMHGARGYSDDLPFAGWYRFARAARIADGPDEVHVGVVARDVLDGRLELLV